MRRPCTMTQVVSSMPWCDAVLILSEIGFGGGLVFFVKPVPRKLVAVAALAQLLIPNLNLHVTKPGSRRSADSHVRRHTQRMCAKRHT